MSGSVEESIQQLKAVPHRIVIIGTSGSGKSFLGRKLSGLTGRKFVDLDDLYWKPGWKSRTDDEFFPLVEEAIADDEWIVCGNYSRTQSMIWPLTEMIVWLDLSLSRCLWQAFVRAIRRSLMKEPCCNGNVETLMRLFSRDSILLWIWNTHSRRKCKYQELFDDDHTTRLLIRLRSRSEVAELIKAFTSLHASRQ